MSEKGPSITPEGTTITEKIWQQCSKAAGWLLRMV